MGITGSDVSKKLDLVLLNDNFTHHHRRRPGRRARSTITSAKFVHFSGSGEYRQVLVMLLAPFLANPSHSCPLQLLWLNLLTTIAC